MARSGFVVTAEHDDPSKNKEWHEDKGWVRTGGTEYPTMSTANKMKNNVLDPPSVNHVMDVAENIHMGRNSRTPASRRSNSDEE